MDTKSGDTIGPPYHTCPAGVVTGGPGGDLQQLATLESPVPLLQLRSRPGYNDLTGFKTLPACRRG
jgi:hypothetical protein